MSLLQRFLTAHYHHVPGEFVFLDEFAREFARWMTDQNLDPGGWSARRIKEALPAGIPLGYGAQNRRVLGNLSRERNYPRRYIQVGRNVRLERPAVA